MKCTAYIDPKTGIALEGEALVNASKNPDAPRCGYGLEPDDMFCPACGACAEVLARRISSTDKKRPHEKRATRLNFWCSAAAFVVIDLLWFVFFCHYYDARNGNLDHGTFLKVLGYANLFAFAYFMQTAVRRLHDIGRSGWSLSPNFFLTIVASIFIVLSILIGVPPLNPFAGNEWYAILMIIAWIAIVTNVGMIVWLGFAKGIKGNNKYGPDLLADGGNKISLRLEPFWLIVIFMVISGLELFVLPYCAKEREKQRQSYDFIERESRVW